MHLQRQSFCQFSCHKNARLVDFILGDIKRIVALLERKPEEPISSHFSITLSPGVLATARQHQTAYKEL